MWRNWFLTILLAVPLFCAGLSCNEKVVETGGEKSSDGHFDTRYIADDFVMAAVVHPTRVYRSKLVQGVLTEACKEDDKGEFDKAIKEIIREIGCDPRTVEQAIALVDKTTAIQFFNMAEAPARGETWEKTKKKTWDRKSEDFKTFDSKTGTESGDFSESRASLVMFLPASTTTTTLTGMVREMPPFPSLIIRFEKTPDQSAILKRLARMVQSSRPKNKTDGDEGSVSHSVPKFVKSKHDGKTIYTLEPVAVCFPDDKTMLISTEVLLEKMLAVDEGKSALAKQLSHLGDRHDFLLAADVSCLTLLASASIGHVKKGSPEAEKKEHISQLKVVSVTAGLDSKELVAVRLTMANETAAKNLTVSLKRAYEKFSENEHENIDQDRTKKFGALMKQVINSKVIEQDGADVLFRIAWPKNFDEDQFPELFVPEIKQAKLRAETAQRKNNLRQIGLAFLIYGYRHRVQRFPSAGKGGLSWRVHLLPLFEETALYEKFRLNEPWDSPHNKKLIKEMPDVFKTSGVSDVGKTSLHVFVGEKALFQAKGRGPSLDELREKDGASNTLLVVEAGPDKADFWTKPGGLPFDIKKDPKAELGNIGELFLVLFCDGSVSYLRSTIDSEILKLLIQPADGEGLDRSSVPRKR